MAFFRSSDIGVDLGTSMVLCYIRNKGIVLREPSVVAVERGSGKLVAVGNEAKEMLGRAPDNLIVMRPMQDGVIASFDATERMLAQYFTRIVGNRVFFKPRAVIAIPSGATEVEKRAVIETSEGAGARYTYLIEEPMAAAIGAGVDIFSPKGNMILDIGAGTADMMVLSLGKAVVSDSIRIGGDKFDAAIVRYFKRQHGVVIGERAAEELKIAFGSAYPKKDAPLMDVKGRSLGGGLPISLQLDGNEITYALAEPLHSIVEHLKDILEQTPPELCGDITENGICLTGGSAQLYGLDKFISEQTGVPCYVAEDPVASVAIGAGKVLENLKIYENVLYDYRRGDYYEE
ncbi:MAG: rod shape-determining protein [Clostridia bacterium]|nr:rod shape-determining protein [Clostridia bacterium]